MRSQPNRDYVSDDVVQTPVALARRLVQHFCPSGRVLEPCKGEGNFLRALEASLHETAPGRRRAKRKTASVDWCEIKEGRDFYEWTERVDWIVTNPPWSQVRRFLQQAMAVADNVVFLMTINHVWTRARVRDIRDAGFGLREIVLLDMPPAFPQSGFQLGAVHLVRGWKGPAKVTDWTRGADARRDVPRRRTLRIPVAARPGSASLPPLNPLLSVRRKT